MSEEAKKLIGDTAPKQIEPPAPTTVSARKGDGSVWNNAGTWEEKDHTPWATAALQATLEKGCVDCGTPIFGTLRIVKVEDLEGSASTPIIRAKKRWIYEYSFKVNWELHVEEDDRKFSGHSNVTDVGSIDELELRENKLKTSLAGKAKEFFSPPSRIYQEVEGIVRACLKTFEGKFHQR